MLFAPPSTNPPTGWKSHTPTTLVRPEKAAGARKAPLRLPAVVTVKSDQRELLTNLLESRKVTLESSPQFTLVLPTISGRFCITSTPAVLPAPRLALWVASAYQPGRVPSSCVPRRLEFKLLNGTYNTPPWATTRPSMVKVPPVLN